MNSMNEYTPDEEDFIDSYAFEPGWSGHCEDKADDARRALAKIKADAWDEAIDEARVRLMMMGADEDELKEANPHR